MAFSLMEIFQYTEAKCAKEVIRTVKKLSPNSNPIYDSARNQVRDKDAKNGNVVFLGNIYNHVKSLSKKERLNYLESFLSASLEQEEVSYETSADQLIPRLKSKSEIAIRQLHSQTLDAEALTWLTYDFTNSFVWELGIDSKSAVTIVSEETLVKLSLSKEEAMAIAKKNLFSRSSSNVFNELIEGLFLSRYDDDHDAARILLTDVVSRLKVKGNPVAFVPAPKVLLICGSEDINILNNIGNYIEKFSKDSRPLSRQPLVLINGNWQDFEPEINDQYAGAINQIKIEELRSYDEQKEMLDRLHETKNVDIFVSSYQLFEKAESAIYVSTTTWSESVHSWIPRTDNVSFVTFENGEANLLGQLSFDEVINTFPELIKPLGYIPERYEVKNFPNKGQLKSLLIN